MADVDRISELPESLLHHILSSLSYKKAIRTSALSKTWRHVGPTRPKIELRESSFKKSGRASFMSVLGKTLQRYNHRKLSVQEFIFEMSSESIHPGLIDLDSRSVLNKHIPTFLTNNIMSLKKFEFSAPHYVLATSLVFRAEFLVELCLSECYFINTNFGHRDEPLFKGLKRLSLDRVLIEDRTLESIIRACTLIEYLSFSHCFGSSSKHIPINNIFQAEFLSELHLAGPNLKIRRSYTELISTKRLKTLSLVYVEISDETLEKIIRSCPLIEPVFSSSIVRDWKTSNSIS